MAWLGLAWLGSACARIAQEFSYSSTKSNPTLRYPQLECAPPQPWQWHKAATLSAVLLPQSHLRLGGLWGALRVLWGYIRGYLPRSVVLLPDHLELAIAGNHRRAAEARDVLCCCGVLVHCGRDFGLHTHEIHAQRGLLRAHVLGRLRVRRARLRIAHSRLVESFTLTWHTRWLHRVVTVANATQFLTL